MSRVTHTGQMTTLAFGNSWKTCSNRTFEVIGAVDNGKALVETARRLQPDVIITDISMPIFNGIEAAKQLKESGSRAKVIFLTVHSDPDFVRACLNVGASGYIVKLRMDSDLLLAVGEALAGRIFVSSDRRPRELNVLRVFRSESGWLTRAQGGRKNERDMSCLRRCSVTEGLKSNRIKGGA